ncbi:MAG: N-6 DNA methylase [Thermodesulfovibrionales bacterium]
MAPKRKDQWEYGDFQTPSDLAEQAISVLIKLDIHPGSILEPTCGRGSFLLSAAQAFPSTHTCIGIDINGQHLSDLGTRVATVEKGKRISLRLGDFFTFKWDELLTTLPEPILIVGNPPWVTSAELGILQSKNLPQKSNFQVRRGYDAITGKSNFDISEWMLLKHFEWLKGRSGIIAILCKTSVARKVLSYAWKSDLPISLAHMYLIDAQKHFGASVDACFFVVGLHKNTASRACLIYENLSDSCPSHSIGFYDDLLLSNVKKYERSRHLKGTDYAYIWRSGIKHDCSKVMELERCSRGYKNGYGELVKLERDYVYPLLKSSDISNGNLRLGRKYMLVTQRFVGESTETIKRTAPATWRYLENHEDALAKRASSIYRNRPRFSVFGVGSYSFSPWKVAISGFYKKLAFKAVGPFEKKTVVLDDTVYFLPCWSESEAAFVAGLLNSQPARDFFDSIIFWSDKRPITIDILKKLDLHALSKELGKEEDYLHFAQQRREREKEEVEGQLSAGHC